MARMIPDNMEFENCKSPGERHIFEALKDKLPDDWTVIYSLRWVNSYNKNSRKSNGEGDFIVINPVHGIMIIEVKGGTISCRDKKWTTKDSNGVVKHIQDPEAQANDTMYEIIELFRSKDINAFVCSAVWFPDTDTGSAVLPLSMPKEIVLDMHALKSPEEKLTNVFEFRRSKLKFRNGSIDNRDFNKILDVLNPEIRLVRSLKRMAEDVNETYVRLTREQFQVLEQLEDNKLMSIKGHAGTGKTVLAVEKCRKDAGEGKSVLYLCFNSRLAEKIKINVEDCFEVYTIHGFVLNYLRSYYPSRVVGFEEDIDFEYIMSEFYEVMENNKEKNIKIYDTVVIDEGQDFKEDWIQPVHNLIDNGCFYIFYDPLQTLYDNGEKKDYRYLNVGTIYNLYRNMRNTDEICVSSLNVVEGLYDKVKLKGIKGQNPEIIICSNKEEENEVLENRIFKLKMMEYIEDDEISILVMNPKNKNRLIKAFEEYKIEVETIRRFKGLENNFIIIPDLDQTFMEDVEKKKLLYVAMSRARAHVIIIVNLEGASRRVKSQLKNTIKENIWRGLDGGI